MGMIKRLFKYYMTTVTKAYIVNVNSEYDMYIPMWGGSAVMIRK